MDSNVFLDEFIDELKKYKDKKPSVKVDHPKSEKVATLLRMTQETLAKEPNLLKIDPPLMICGDIHGQFFDLLRIFEMCGYPPQTRYLFLGDYVDRGKYSVESICLLFALKMRYPGTVYLLRGNHEDASLNRVYGFYDECKRNYSVKMWQQFTDVFKYLPIAALVGGRILCMHGGISPEMKHYNQIDKIDRVGKIPDSGLMCDLLWADPDAETDRWGENGRGISYVFGEKVLQEFVESSDIDLVCRAHEVKEGGYEFFGNKKLITIFSAPNYTGEFDNNAAMLNVDGNLLCSIVMLEPAKKRKI